MPNHRKNIRSTEYSLCMSNKTPTQTQLLYRSKWIFNWRINFYLTKHTHRNEHFIVLLRTIKKIYTILMRCMNNENTKSKYSVEILSFFLKLIWEKNKIKQIPTTVTIIVSRMRNVKSIYIYLEMFLWLSTHWKYTIQILKHSAKCLSNWYVSYV